MIFFGGNVTKPEEKKTIPESDNPTDRRILLDRRCGLNDRRKQPDRRKSITDFKTDNSIDRRILPDRRRGLKDRRLLPDRRCLNKKEIALKK